MESWKELIYKTLDMLYIPDSLIEMRGRAVLHISDTPSSFYPCLKKLINLLEPLAVIHTGDLVDEIKLAIQPNRLQHYIKRLRPLAQILEGGRKRDVIVIIGNHDNEDAARQVFHKSLIVNKSGSFNVCGVSLNVSHHFEGLPISPGALNLFGHNQFMPEQGGGDVYLNRLLSMHLIDPDNGAIHPLSYPRFVDQNRLLKRKFGL